jgi:quercetin dioxygenase-like cupin family protein
MKFPRKGRIFLMNVTMRIAMFAASVAGCLGLLIAQDAAAPAAGGRGAGRGAAQTWYVEKTKGGVYIPPNKPLTKLADLKAKHAGQPIWKELVMKDPEHEAEYNGAVPGTKYAPEMHPDTPQIMVVVAGELHFNIEGQPPIVATRGGIVNILKTTVYSYEVAGTQPAYWVAINPVNYKIVYPTDGPAPKATHGGEIIKVSFGHTPTPYPTGTLNQPYWNLFEAAAQCNQAGPKINEDHLFANPLYGFADANDPLNTCAGRGGGGGGGRGGSGGGGRGGGGGGRGGAAAGAFDPNSTFGHMHAGPAEWWIVQVGHIRGQFEGTGEFVGEEGDILYASPMSWHQMGFVGSGPSCRLALGAYNLINMGNTGAAQ